MLTHGRARHLAGRGIKHLANVRVVCAMVELGNDVIVERLILLLAVLVPASLPP